MTAAPSVGILQDWDQLVALLPVGWRELGHRFRLFHRVTPPHLGGKLTNLEPLLRLVFFHVASASSLRATTAAAAAAGLVSLSWVALHRWMRKLGPYLAALLSELVAERLGECAGVFGGYEAVLADATVVTRPGARGTTARVHYAVALPTFAPVHHEVTGPEGGETLTRFSMRPGQLWVVDRGYSHAVGVAHAREAGAEVLVRWNEATMPLRNADGGRFSPDAWLAALHAPWQSAERALVACTADGRKVNVRLLALRLDAACTERARKRLRREHGAKVTAAQEKRAGWVLLVTTVPAERMPREQAFEAYRFRWQVELVIKRDKSLGGLDRLPNERPDTIAAWLCAHAVLSLVVSKLLSTPVPQLFPPSAVYAARRRASFAARADGRARDPDGGQTNGGPRLDPARAGVGSHARGVAAATAGAAGRDGRSGGRCAPGAGTTPRAAAATRTHCRTMRIQQND